MINQFIQLKNPMINIMMSTIHGKIMDPINFLILINPINLNSSRINFGIHHKINFGILHKIRYGRCHKLILNKFNKKKFKNKIIWLISSPKLHPEMKLLQCLNNHNNQIKQWHQINLPNFNHWIHPKIHRMRRKQTIHLLKMNQKLWKKYKNGQLICLILMNKFLKKNKRIRKL